jgi:hypothetical protein
MFAELDFFFVRQTRQRGAFASDAQLCADIDKLFAV